MSKHLPNAPIREALIDIRTQLPTEFEVGTFLDAYAEFENEYPTKKDKIGIAYHIGPDVELAKQEKEIEGFLFHSKDGRIVQFRKNGFTFNKLKPYSSWEDIYPEAMHYWSLYCQIASPITVTRLAVRNINDIELPGDNLELEEYIKVPPRLPPDLYFNITGFMSRIGVQQAESEINGWITLSTEKSAKPEYAHFVLDIDAYKEVDLNRDSEQIEEILNSLRRFKNDLFFGLITETLKSRFE